jgi:D,D-heptose 1,7-bisphosphate phosphatase
MQSKRNKAIFLDRDGVINEDHDYVYKIEDMDFIPGSIDGLKKLQDSGYLLIIITNQSGIGRGYYTEEQYLKFRQEMHKRLQNFGIKITDEFYSPFHPKENSICRKPSPFLIQKAIEKYDINAKISYMIGDKTSDILSGINANIKTILVLTGKSGKDGLYDINADYTCKNLNEASKIITQNDKKNN